MAISQPLATTITLILLVSGPRTATSSRPLPGVRAPAYPLIAHSPFVNWWSPSVEPTATAVRHVRNDKEAGMTAMVRVDGTAYRLLGPPCTPNVSALPLQGLPEIHPTRTVYQFAGASVRVNMTFASPKFMEDLHALSLPLSLIYFDVSRLSFVRRRVSLD